MINIVSIAFVLMIFILCELVLYFTKGSSRLQAGRGKSYLRLWISILGGAIPIGLLGAEIIPRDGVAVILALVGFIYFIVIRKTNEGDNE